MKGLNDFTIYLLVSLVGFAVCVSIPYCQNNSEELLQHPNPNNFWYCHHEGADALEIPCPEGRGFLRTDDRSGCVPYSDWKCTAKIQPLCKTDAEYYKLHRHTNPNKFWGCPEPQGTPPVELNCPRGNGFVDNDKNVGCVPYDNVWVCDKADDSTRE